MSEQTFEVTMTLDQIARISCVLDHAECDPALVKFMDDTYHTARDVQEMIARAVWRGVKLSEGSLGRALRADCIGYEEVDGDGE